MPPENKPEIPDADALSREEERVSKRNAYALFVSGALDVLPAGTADTLQKIHAGLFGGIDASAGALRTEELAETLRPIGEMPQSTFDEIADKYLAMYRACPFRRGNGLSIRLWLDGMLKHALGRIADWSRADKADYLWAMERTAKTDADAKALLKGVLTDRTNDRFVFIRSLDASCYFDGYRAYLTKNIIDQPEVQKMKTIVFVCSGNTCRSPMAEGIFRVLAEKYDLKDVTCTSCGTSAVTGAPVTDFAVEAAAAYGADISAHRSRPLTEPLLEEGDLFVCMTEMHAASLRPYLPSEKICVLGRGISDPYGGSADTYRRCAAQIHDALDAWIREKGQEL